MDIYKNKERKLSGSNYKEVKKQANFVFKKIERQTRRRPYVRSAYFNKEKVFFDYFWLHLLQKREKERTIRLKYFACAIELIKYSRQEPIKEPNPYKKIEYLYRFKGISPDNSVYFVQIKENIKSGMKYFMSCFPLN